MIVSLANPKVKRVRMLQSRRRARYREHRFVIEGVRLAEEVVRAGLVPDFVLYTTSLAEDARGAAVLEALEGVGAPCHLVDDAVMRACTDTETPPGLVAVLPFVRLPAPDHPTFTLVVDGVRTPGNLGAILRTAAAAGVDWVLLAPGTVDLYNPKTVRGGAGAHFRIPTRAMGWREIRRHLEGQDVWLAAARGDVPYTVVNWRKPIALIVGGEARGVSQEAQELAHGRVVIPMERGVESLNAAVATGILLFEVVRQRRSASA